ncbi:MAG: nucleotidyltransferase family protein [Candidatus Caldatribacteriaceae bacterium]
MVDVVILAGSRGGEIEEKFGVSDRALLVIEGKFMIEYVIEALRDVSSIGKIVVVGAVEDFQSRIGNQVANVVRPGKNPFESTLNGLKALKPEGKVLVVASDIPLLRGEMVEDFFLRCEKRKADFYYPIVRRELYEEKIGKGKRTFVKVKEGCFTGGNLLLLDPKVVEKKKEWIARIIESRKNPLAMARVLGAKIILKYILRSLRIEDVEKRVENILGMKGLAIVTPYPEIGFDVDRVEHVDIAKRLLSR